MKWFVNLKTQTKLISGFGTVAAMLAIVGLVGMASLTRVNGQLDDLYEHHLVGVAAILSAESDMLRAGLAVRQSVLASSDAAIEEQRGTVVRAAGDMLAELETAAGTLETTEAKASLDRVRARHSEWSADMLNVLEMAKAGRRSQAMEAIAEFSDDAGAMSAEMEALRRDKLAQAKEATVAADKVGTQTALFMLLLILLGAAGGVGLGLFIARLIAAPLQRAVSVLESVAEGDFTQSIEVQSNDELGRMAAALNAAVTGMRTALQQVHQNASAVAAAAKQLSSATDEISSGAQEQASSLEETAASLEEMTSAVKQNADNASHAAQLARSAREVAEKGGQVVSTAVNAMDEINSSSRKIADIITAIDEIAFQTNLLALNAAVEAARAGEQGRGFAVVAAEVRNLAQRSASSAKEIKTLINDSVDKVEAGSRLVNQSGETLEEIVSSVKRVTDIVGEIAASSREQSTGIEQVNTAVTQMDGVTQANASQTEEMSSTAESLSDQAQQLMNVVRRFKLDSSGSTSAATPSAGSHTASHASAPKPARKALKIAKRSTRPAVHASASAPAPEMAATGTDGGFEEF
ncbi:MAG: MCP four helix bundle domain-containing protein [Candidatus Eisenbacteria bacterium]|nr:MCP four helix bundle domain-containing protein [Candidatus Eisenbacteria bacterium]